MVWLHTDARGIKVEYAMVILMFALFAANVLQWRGVPVFFDDQPSHPLGPVFFSTGLLLQALASLARRRSIVLSYLLLGASLPAIWLGVTDR